MTLDSLVKEIETRSAKEVRELEAKLEGERRAIEETARTESERMRAESEKKAQIEAAREKARLVASAKLQAKKVLFEAREKRTAAALEEVRLRLGAYAKGPEYGPLLSGMVSAGSTALGGDVRILARPEDVSLLPAKMRALVDTARPLRGMGGLVVEKKDGSRSLNFTFEELLRLREDRVREILSR
ncbi:MAG: V-type ATP synthase subunit E [Euryarchaeota archaeon]|nr:V-type ATP synthase subunit E [Euryarchaeota archaeon]MDE1836757.1 V-type ATP synthase subunit E [Euryarchaeota archaeon]MDE1879775.1 V-type ATP synthase subunit E [Euryarchaeota archaeon]MDE2044741.1 V-type ATP synthase subunit E [Thermoplasmata archaeon]